MRGLFLERYSAHYEIISPDDRRATATARRIAPVGIRVSVQYAAMDSDGRVGVYLASTVRFPFERLAGPCLARSLAR